jgi:hypothetical protein
MKNKSLFTKYSFLWVTLVLFLASLAAHWSFGWFAFVEEQSAHGQPIEFRSYAIEMLRDTFENWQSEFLQLMWQVAGLAFLFYVGSPQSKEEDERLEEKIDKILSAVDPKHADEVIRALEKKYPHS